MESFKKMSEEKQCLIKCFGGWCAMSASIPYLEQWLNQPQKQTPEPTQSLGDKEVQEKALL